MKSLTAVPQPVLRGFSDMGFCTKVFDYANVTRWNHCNADNLKIQ